MIMTIETLELENGDYIIHEISAYPNGVLEARNKRNI